MTFKAFNYSKSITTNDKQHPVLVNYLCGYKRIIQKVGRLKKVISAQTGRMDVITYPSKSRDRMISRCGMQGISKHNNTTLSDGGAFDLKLCFKPCSGTIRTEILSSKPELEITNSQKELIRFTSLSLSDSGDFFF